MTGTRVVQVVVLYNDINRAVVYTTNFLCTYKDHFLPSSPGQGAMARLIASVGLD